MGSFGNFRGCLAAVLITTLVADVLRQDSECPCTPSGDTIPLKGGAAESHLLCIDDNSVGRAFFAKLSPKQINLNYKFLEDDFGAEEAASSSLVQYSRDGCDVVIRLIVKDGPLQSKNEKCPGVCKSTPSILVPTSFLNAVLQNKEASFPMCSLNLTTSYHHGKVSCVYTSLGHVLRTISIRRLLECEDMKDPLLSNWDYIPINSTDVRHVIDDDASRQHEHDLQLSLLSKRKVYGVIIWAASVSRIRIAHNQATVLRLQAKVTKDVHRIVGWIGTEDLYPCNGRKRCIPTTNDSSGDLYHSYMPATINHLSSTAAGWTCAQRRPLRVTAHVTKLYDPEFVVLGDDDTFVNIKMLSYDSILGMYIRQTMNTQKIVLGDLRMWYVTKFGFFYGGGGYLFGKSVIDSLNSFTIQGRHGTDKDDYRTPDQLDKLGILEEAIPLSKELCPDCVRVWPTNSSTTLQYKTADLGVRVVDMCVNMMAGAGTCYHSDHAFSRCLAHAVYASFKNAYQGISITSAAGTLHMVMTYDGNGCDLSKELTCHRHVAIPHNPALPPLYVAKH